MSTVKQEGLTELQTQVLEQIKGGKKTAKEITEATKKDQAVISVTLGELYKLKVVKRELVGKLLNYSVIEAKEEKATKAPKAAKAVKAEKTEGAEAADAPKVEKEKKPAETKQSRYEKYLESKKEWDKPQTKEQAEKRTGVTEGTMIEFTPFRSTKKEKAIAINSYYCRAQKKDYVTAYLLTAGKRVIKNATDVTVIKAADEKSIKQLHTFLGTAEKEAKKAAKLEAAANKKAEKAAKKEADKAAVKEEKTKASKKVAPVKKEVAAKAATKSGKKNGKK